MRRLLNVVWVAAATVGVAGCTDNESATNLRPEGPPTILQVRMIENYEISGSTADRTVFAFGEHEMADDSLEHEVTSAKPLQNKLRIVMDELLVGNSLQEIQCRGSVDGDAYQRVPLGTTPDHIAACSGPQDVLRETCTGTHRVCVCEQDGGCDVNGTLVERGEPVGVQDINQDGAADGFRFIAGSVGIRCGSIDVPIDLDASYWYPSGTQLVPARGGFDALGPAIVLVPRDGLPTNLPCQLVFADDVVDKQGERVCAPAGGDPNGACEAGDVSAFQFTVSALAFQSEPEDMATGVSLTDPAVFISNMTIDATTLSGILVENVTDSVTLVEGTDYTLSVVTGRQVRVTWTNPLTAETEYRITLPTSLKDIFDQGMPQARSYTFTTGN